MTENETVDFFASLYPKRLMGKSVGLVGSLGCGKTHLVRSILIRLSSEFGWQIGSPTYNLCNVYQADGTKVYHFDLYRIESERELYDIGIWESMEEKEALTFIEWVDLVPKLKRRCDMVVRIDDSDRTDREYGISAKETAAGEK